MIGRGLGLPISRGIARDHSERLWIENLPTSRGATTVHVDLPAVCAANDNG
ncbi:MAG: ATP-binding protein [Candidatus Bipolaricaulota bacterium]|nr:ATP-binding protein [Candidatus Bipolaricaulota bacterium]